ncbi:MAG: LiaF domain-containing protein [Thermoanaerobaculia bacterium]
MSDELRPFGPSAPPEPPSARHVTPRLVLGLGIIVFGVLLLLDNLDLLDASRFLRYLFPCVLLGIGATVLGQKNPWGWFWMLAGGWMLLGALDIVELSFWKLFFPVALVFAGATMVSRGLSGARRAPANTADRDQVSNAFAFMSGNERRNDSSAFRGGDLFAFMGGVMLDLRHAKPTPEGAVIDAFAMWGGIEIRVPENWRVVSEVVPLLGGFEDKTRPAAEPGQVVGRLTVRGVAIMGGIEVKN